MAINRLHVDKLERVAERAYTCDLNEYLLDTSASWQEDLLGAAAQARQVDVMPSPTSRRAADDTEALPMRVLNGVELQEKVPWLGALVDDEELLELVGRAVGSTVCWPTLEGANIHRFIMNVLGPGEHYEPHVDANGATVIIPVTDHDDSEVDGQFVLTDHDVRINNPLQVPIPNEYVQVAQRSGNATILDGTDRTHWVMPPADGDRVTLLLNIFTSIKQEIARDDIINPKIGLTGPDIEM